MPFDYGLRLNNRQRIANAREKPIEAHKNQSVDGAEGLFLRSGSPQNVYLLPQRQNFRLERCPRQKQIYDHPNNEPDKISHPATASPDSQSTASQIEFATGTAGCVAILGKRGGEECNCRKRDDAVPAHSQLPLLQERRYLTSAAAARIKTMMTSNQTSPMAHIIPGIIPSIIIMMIHLT